MVINSNRQQTRAGVKSSSNAVGVRRTFLFAAVILPVALMILFSVLYESGSKEAPAAATIVWISIAVSLVFGAAAYVANRSDRSSFLHPLVAPLAYIVYALLVPLAYISITGNDIENMPSSMLSVGTAAAMAITILAYCLGVVVARVAEGRMSQSGVRMPLILRTSLRDAEISLVTRDIGRVVLLLALAAQVHEWVAAGPVAGRTYGADQLAYDANTAITIFGESLVGVGCLLVMRGNSHALRRPLTIVDSALIATICAIGLFVLGSRAEAIAPVILFVWFWVKCGRRIAIGSGLAIVAFVAALFVVVAQLRTNGASGSSPISSLLVETSSPVFLTDNVMRVIPANHGFFDGSTYLASLKYMLPGPIGRAVFGGVGGTGSLVYRDLIHFTYSGQGWGFSYPTEAFLNFGLGGVSVMGIALGLLFGSSWNWARRVGIENAIGAYLYPLLISYLPFGIRSDALGELKNVVYPMVICAGALVIAHIVVKNYGRRVPLAASMKGSL